MRVWCVGLEAVLLFSFCLCFLLACLDMGAVGAVVNGLGTPAVGAVVNRLGTSGANEFRTNPDQLCLRQIAQRRFPGKINSYYYLIQ